MSNGKILNLSSKPLWVVETDTGPAIAHKLQPSHRSPPAVDADGVKAVDGTAISHHTSWWKFRLIEVEVVDDAPELRIRRCVSPACDAVEDGEFGTVTYDPADGWGEPISEPERGALLLMGRAGCDEVARAENPRVAKAKQLLSAGATYLKGCSGFVSAVLGIPWEDANSLMGASPTYVGVDNDYTGLAPGDLVGWKNPSGSGHVAIYVGEAGEKFIDVKTENEKPRKIVNGYGGEKLYKSSKY